jgi:2-phosphosulfolactate phosphatase
MKVDVAFSPAGLATQEVAGRPVFVVDVLRATTTIAAALHHGARAVVPCASPDEAVRLGQTLGKDVVLAGEKHCLPIPGFQLGNSPREMTPEAVKGRIVALATTNGTRALLAVAHASVVHPVAAANFSVAAARARALLEQGGDLLVVCAGRDGAFGLDDAYVAGRLLSEALGGRTGRSGLNDAAIAALQLVRTYRLRWDRPLRLSRAGRELAKVGLAEDIADAARMDAYPVLSYLHDRRVTPMAAAA